MTSSRTLLPLSLIWIFPVMYFVVDPNYNPSAVPTWLAFFASLVLCLFNKRYLIWTIPFITLISPLAAANNPFPFLPSEVYVALLGILGGSILVSRNVIQLNLLKGDRYLLAIFFLFIVATLLSFEFHNLIKSVISIFMIFLIFCFTRGVLKEEQDITVLLNSVLLAALFSSLLIFTSLFSGVSLNSLVDSSGSGVIYATDVAWWRASHFYANAGYILGIAALISFIRIILSDRFWKKIISFLIFMVLFSTLLAMVEKTGLVALIIAVIFSISLFAIKRGAARTLLIAFTLSLALVPIIYSALFFTQNIDLLTKFQIAGFSERMCVLNSTIGVFIENPHRIFFGFGPDSILLLSNEFTQAASSNCSGRQEGTIDSGYFSYLFDFGLFFLISFLMFLLHSLYRFIVSFKLSERDSLDEMYLILISVIIYLMFCALTDVLSTSKIAWLVFQLFSIFGITLNFTKQKKEFSSKFL